jgi:hypothetical protein
VFTDCPDVLLSAVGHNSDGSALSDPRGSNKQ